MKNLIKDESGVILAWASAILGLVFLIMAYAMFVPLGNIIQDNLIELGSPYAPQMFLRKMFIWTFVLMGAGCIAFALLSSYLNTYDQGKQPDMNFEQRYL